jgi:hypothetical protein
MAKLAEWLRSQDSESHPRWTKGGELLLIGDHGRFGVPDGDPDLWITGQVAAIDGVRAVVHLTDGRERRFVHCAELTGRGRIVRDVDSDRAAVV